MKKYICLIVILIFSCGYAQKEELPNIKGNFKITAIDSLKHYYLITATNEDNLLIKILANKPKKRVLKNLKKNTAYSSIQLNQSYYFDLDSMTWSMGYLPTENIIMDDEVIWNRKASNFFVYETKALKGLFINKP